MMSLSKSCLFLIGAGSVGSPTSAYPGVAVKEQQQQQQSVIILEAVITPIITAVTL